MTLLVALVTAAGEASAHARQAIAASLALAMIVATPAWAHDGLTDVRGCHTDRDGTNFHCHEDRARNFEAEAGERETAERAAAKAEQKRRSEAQAKKLAAAATGRDLAAMGRRIDQMENKLANVAAHQAAAGPQRDATTAFLLSYGGIALGWLIGGLVSETSNLYLGAFVAPALPATVTALAWQSESGVALAGALLVDVAAALVPLLVGVSIANADPN